MQSNNLGRTVQGAKHDDDTAILIEVRGGLGTAASVILVGHFQGSKDAEGLSAFGGGVDVAVRRKRCRGDEENALLSEPGCEFTVDVFVWLAHEAEISLRGHT